MPGAAWGGRKDSERGWRVRSVHKGEQTAEDEPERVAKPAADLGHAISRPLQAIQALGALVEAHLGVNATIGADGDVAKLVVENFPRSTRDEAVGNQSHQTDAPGKFRLFEPRVDNTPHDGDGQRPAHLRQRRCGRQKPTSEASARRVDQMAESWPR